MKKSILLIDDDHLVVKSLERLLVIEGYDVIRVENGRDALGAIENKDFDLIISDIRMPEIDGVETISKIRENCERRGKKQIPEIFITGYTEGESYNKAKGLNTAGFLYKPFDKNEFLGYIAKALGINNAIL